MRRCLLFGGLCAALLAARARGERYWVEYDASCGQFPEEVGWTRHWGDEFGSHHGGAERRLEDGALVLDSLASDRIYDYYEVDRLIDPGFGERFVAEWQLRVDEPSDDCDAQVVIARDDPPGHVAIEFATDGLHIPTEHLTLPVDPGVFHAYRFESNDMQAYALYLDGALLHEGLFQEISLLQSFVGFGDGAQGARSLSRWNYFRFGAVPEPSACALAAVAATVACQRSIGNRKQ